MKRIKRKIKVVKYKYDKRLARFWETNLNPITGWRKPKKLGDTIIEDIEFEKPDQQSVFRPKGFH